MQLIDYLYPKIEGSQPPLPTIDMDFSNLNQGEIYVNKDSSLDESISSVESGGNYKAENPHSSAVGKYQFLWNTWRDKITTVTGISNKKDFRDNPQAQEDFYKWYKANELYPAVNRLRKYNKKGLDDEKLAKLIHFKGEGGAREWLMSGIDRTTEHNMSIEKYLSHR